MRSLFTFTWKGDYYEAVVCSIRPNENYVISESGRKFDLDDIEIIEQWLKQ